MLRGAERIMRKSWVTKAVVCGIILLFVGTSGVPSIHGNFSKIVEKDGAHNHQKTVSDSVAMNSNGDIVLDFSFEKPVMEKVTLFENTSDRVLMAGLPNANTPGEPRVPTKQVNVLLPQGQMVEAIDITVQGKIFIGDGFELELGEKPVPISNDFIDDSPCSLETYDEYRQRSPSSYDPDESYPLLLDNSSRFDASKPFPTTDYTTVGTYRFRGYSILVLALYPLHYIKDTGEVYYYNHFTVTIKTTDNIQPCSLFRGLQRDADEVKHKVVNPEMVQTYTKPPKHQRSSSLVDPSDSYQYVIITSKIFSRI
jgi:hypothetical protein